MEKNQLILSVKDLNIQFNLRGKALHAIRGIDLDIYHGEVNTENLSPATSLAYFGIEKQKAKGLKYSGLKLSVFLIVFQLFLRKILLDIQRKFTYSVPVENY